MAQAVRLSTTSETVILTRQRARIEKAVVRLLDVLDAMETPAEDREDSGDHEPGLGAVEAIPDTAFPRLDQRQSGASGTDDVELDLADFEEDGTERDTAASGIDDRCLPIGNSRMAQMPARRIRRQA